MIEKARNQQHLDNQFLMNKFQQNTTGTYGTILSYDSLTNTATVVISKQETNEIDDILNGVPCPTYMGLQIVAPEPGRPCWIIFKNGDVTQPLISHYYNHAFSKYDYHKYSNSPNQLPSHLLR